MISLSLNFEIVARHYFEGFYSRDSNRQLLNKGIKFYDLRVHFVQLHFVFQNDSELIFTILFFLGLCQACLDYSTPFFRIIVKFTNRLKETHRE